MPKRGAESDTRLKLYRLVPSEDALKEMPEYDIATGFVVCAKSPSAARRLAAEDKSDESFDIWLMQAYSGCTLIGYALESTKEGVILKATKDG